jgi:hypothetical protein
MIEPLEGRCLLSGMTVGAAVDASTIVGNQL